MPADVNALVQEGIAAIKAGRKADARKVLMKAVELDEQSEQGWLWLSAVVESVDEQQICLENVIAINPQNAKALKGLEVLTKGQQQKPAAPPPAKPAPAPSAPAASPFGDFSFDAQGFTSNPFEGTGFDSNPYSSGASNDPALSGWGSGEASYDPNAVPSSVDWNRGGAPAAGSGKDVKLPSAEEYDSWVTGLNLPGNDLPDGGMGGNFNPASGPFSTNDFNFETAFDAAAQPSGSGPFDFNAPPADNSALSGFGGANANDGFANRPYNTVSVNFDNAPDPFTIDNAFGSDSGALSSGSYGAAPFGGGAAENSYTSDEGFGAAEDFGGGDSFNAYAESTAPASGSYESFSPSSPAPNTSSDEIFGRVPGGPRNSTLGDSIGRRSALASAARPKDDLDDLFNDGGGSSASSGRNRVQRSGRSPVGNRVSPAQLAAFKAIPPEIEAGGSGGKLSVVLLASVGVLAFLNLLSVLYLINNLTPK